MWDRALRVRGRGLRELTAVARPRWHGVDGKRGIEACGIEASSGHTAVEDGDGGVAAGFGVAGFVGGDPAERLEGLGVGDASGDVGADGFEVANSFEPGGDVRAAEDGEEVVSRQVEAGCEFGDGGAGAGGDVADGDLAFDQVKGSERAG
jgi:hypothetical protein